MGYRYATRYRNHTKAFAESKKQSVRRPPVNFAKCGIPVGAELVLVDDPSVVAVVVSERKDQYNGEITSLSAISDRIKRSLPPVLPIRTP